MAALLGKILGDCGYGFAAGKWAEGLVSPGFWISGTIARSPETPSLLSPDPGVNEAILGAAISVEGAFCAATHYWELATPSVHRTSPR